MKLVLLVVSGVRLGRPTCTIGAREGGAAVEARDTPDVSIWLLFLSSLSVLCVVGVTPRGVRWFLDSRLFPLGRLGSMVRVPILTRSPSASPAGRREVIILHASRRWSSWIACSVRNEGKGKEGCGGNEGYERGWQAVGGIQGVECTKLGLRPSNRAKRG